MLAASAEGRHEAAGLDLADPRTAAWARLAALVVDRQPVASLLLERRRDADPQDVDRVGDRGPGRGVQGVDLLRREGRTLAEREQSRRVEDLVAVGVADPGDEGLVLQEVLELARVALDPRLPGIERERRIIRVGSESSSVRPGTTRWTPAGTR